MSKEEIDALLNEHYKWNNGETRAYDVHGEFVYIQCDGLYFCDSPEHIATLLLDRFPEIEFVCFLGLVFSRSTLNRMRND